MSILLWKELETRYVIDKLDMHLKINLDKLVTRGEVVDLAECRFGPKSAKVLAEYYDKIIFENTEIPEWDSILKYNRDLLDNPEEEWPILDITGKFTKDNLIDGIYAIPSGKYKLKVELSNILDKCIAVLIILARPDIDFDLELCMHDIATIVADRIHIDDFNESEVYVVHTPYITRVNKDDIRYSDDLFLPCSFGRDKIVSFIEEVDVRPEYNELIRYIVNTIDSQFVEKKAKNVDITKYLQFREG